MVAVPPFFLVFISLPFADLRAERSRLERAVFRPLAADCARRGGCLQIIDLRWGISSEAGLVQRTMTLCLQEVERCRAVSPRLDFLLFMGTAAGGCPRR